MKLRLLSLFAAFAYGLTASHGALAETIYDQPTDLKDSFISISGNHWNAYSNFTLASAATITTVSWYGNTFSNGDPTSFTINIYANDPDAVVNWYGGPPRGGGYGFPGTLLDSTVVGGSSPVFYGVDNQQSSVDTYSAAIDPFSAAAGTEYWLSIVANTDWAWEESGLSRGEISIGYGYAQAGYADEAFSLATSPTPEPSSYILLGTGLLGAAGIARRKLSRA